VVKDCNKIKNISVAIAGIYEDCINLKQQEEPLENKVGKYAGVKQRKQRVTGIMQIRCGHISQ
jgi:hypothetical protein